MICIIPQEQNLFTQEFIFMFDSGSSEMEK